MRFKLGDFVDLVRSDGIIFDTFELLEENIKNDSIRYFADNSIAFVFEKDEDYHKNGFYILEYEPKEGDYVIVKPKHPRMNKETSFTVKRYSKHSCKGCSVIPYTGSQIPNWCEQ